MPVSTMLLEMMLVTTGAWLQAQGAGTRESEELRKVVRGERRLKLVLARETARGLTAVFVCGREEEKQRMW